jgi:MoaA/NifB/PqqE/SkfB family radical SAM enzyme
MLNTKEINEVHVELTDKCQAQCPMCARNFNGGALRPFIRGGDISFEDFKEWFPVKFLSQLRNFYSCGNYGDPAFARDCLEIYDYVRKCNSDTRLALHTNGGMRNKQWWTDLAKSIGTQSNSEVIFAVDGFKGKHELYRRNTKFDKVIENMCAFIEAGGKARVDSLVFEHNEHETEELEEYLLTLGVHSVDFVKTTRFYEMDKFEVLDKQGNFEYYLKPANQEEYKMTPNYTLQRLLDKDTRQSAIANAKINPRCQNEKSVYVDPYGNVFPCCWIGGEYQEEKIQEDRPIHILRNIVVENTKNVLQDVGVPNCADGLFKTDKDLWEKLPQYWKGESKCITCARQCSTMMYDAGKYA